MRHTGCPVIGDITIETVAAAKSVYDRLRKVGFTKTYIRKVAALPTWWDDSLWDDPPSRVVGYINLSRHLGIDIATLQNPLVPLRLRELGECKYKMQASTTKDELLLPSVIASRAAQLAAAAMDRPNQPVLSADDVRSTILERASWVSFDELLDHCWSIGIPVVHVDNFPADAKKKPMGFTLLMKGRPAIVLSSKKRQPAWQLFILAHELGHLHHGHVPNNGTLMDETVRKNKPDAEETQADAYAIELLTGKATTRFQLPGRWPNARKFAELAQDFGRRKQVDPGHVVLNCAHNESESGFWGVANAALDILYPNANAIKTIGERLAANLDWERLPEDDSEFLMRITGQEIPE